jgi:glycosyltransferase 2 family protein
VTAPPDPPASRYEGLLTATAERLRSPGAQLAGFAIGLVAAGFFVIAAAEAWQDAAPLFRQMSWRTIAGALLGFAWFQVLATLSLRALGAFAPARIWAATQLIKYLPLPGASAAGMLGSSVRYGHTPQRAMGLLVRHTLVLIGASVAVGSVVLGDLAAIVWEPLRGGAIAFGVLAGIGLAWASSRGRFVDRLSTVTLALAAWGGLVVALTLALPSSITPSLVASSAYAIAWAAGLLVIPVPAGIGVREAALLLLLEPVTGTEAAIAFAVGTRILHALADGALVVVFAYPNRTSTTTGGGSPARS